MIEWTDPNARTPRHWPPVIEAHVEFLVRLGALAAEDPLELPLRLRRRRRHELLEARRDEQATAEERERQREKRKRQVERERAEEHARAVVAAARLAGACA